MFFLLSTNNLFAEASNVRSGDFETYFPNGSSLGFQNFPNWVLVSITSGNLNSSNGRIFLYSGGGYFYFTANESVTLQITYNVTTVKLAGDNDNELRAINNGASFTISQNNNVQIIWVETIEAWLPVMFIFGIVGLLSMFGGVTYGDSFNEKRRV